MCLVWELWWRCILLRDFEWGKSWSPNLPAWSRSMPRFWPDRCGGWRAGDLLQFVPSYNGRDWERGKGPAAKVAVAIPRQLEFDPCLRRISGILTKRDNSSITLSPGCQCHGSHFFFYNGRDYSRDNLLACVVQWDVGAFCLCFCSVSILIRPATMLPKSDSSRHMRIGSIHA